MLVIEDRGLSLDHLAAYGTGDQIHIEDPAVHHAGRDRCDARVRWQELRPSLSNRPSTSAEERRARPVLRPCGSAPDCPVDALRVPPTARSAC